MYEISGNGQMSHSCSANQQEPSETTALTAGNKRLSNPTALGLLKAVKSQCQEKTRGFHNRGNRWLCCSLTQQNTKHHKFRRETKEAGWSQKTPALSQAHAELRCSVKRGICTALLKGKRQKNPQKEPSRCYLLSPLPFKIKLHKHSPEGDTMHGKL